LNHKKTIFANLYQIKMTDERFEKIYLTALRICAEEGDENAARELRESFEAALKAAETENAAAQFSLAQHYEYGFGTAEAETEAAKWYKKAALNRHATAMWCVAWSYRGVEEYEQEYNEWRKKAAFAFHAEGKIDYALHCLRGEILDDEELIALRDELERIEKIE